MLERVTADRHVFSLEDCVKELTKKTPLKRTVAAVIATRIAQHNARAGQLLQILLRHNLAARRLHREIV
jgi:hypothetical protein